MSNLTRVHIDTEYYLGEDVPEVLIVDSNKLHAWIQGKHFTEIEPPEQLTEDDYIFNPGAESGVAMLYRIKDIKGDQAEVEIYHQIDETGTSVSPSSPDNPDTDLVHIDYETKLAKNGHITILEQVHD